MGCIKSKHQYKIVVDTFQPHIMIKFLSTNINEIRIDVHIYSISKIVHRKFSRLIRWSHSSKAFIFKDVNTFHAIKSNPNPINSDFVKIIDLILYSYDDMIPSKNYIYYYDFDYIDTSNLSQELKDGINAFKSRINLLNDPKQITHFDFNEAI